MDLFAEDKEGIRTYVAEAPTDHEKKVRRREMAEKYHVSLPTIAAITAWTTIRARKVSEAARSRDPNALDPDHHRRIVESMTEGMRLGEAVAGLQARRKALARELHCSIYRVAAVSAWVTMRSRSGTPIVAIAPAPDHVAPDTSAAAEELKTIAGARRELSGEDKLFIIEYVSEGIEAGETQEQLAARRRLLTQELRCSWQQVAAVSSWIGIRKKNEARKVHIESEQHAIELLQKEAERLGITIDDMVDDTQFVAIAARSGMFVHVMDYLSKVTAMSA